MGSIRYKTLKEIGGCNITYICETDQTNELPNGVRQTQNPEDVLLDKDVDAIIICTPNNISKDFVVKSINHEKHVFCEKPPGRNLTELKEMIAAASKYPQLKLMFGFNHRHHDSIIRAKKLVDSKQYGKILWMRGRYGKSVDKNFSSTWRAKKELSGGGIFLDQGIHMLDLFLMMCGDFEEVKAYISNLYWELDVEDNVFAIFRNKKGQVASLHSTMTQWRHLFAFEIFLEKGYIVINGLKTSSNTYGDESMTVVLNKSLPPEAGWTKEDNSIYPIDNSWRRELEIFIDSIRYDKEIPIGNTRDALKLMTLVDKIYKQ